MSSTIKNQTSILKKLGIQALNPMQKDAQHAIHSTTEVVLLSPTGSGKTLAFLLPIIAELDPQVSEVQTLVIVPTRELAIQIEQVAREMGTGYKINAVYGGRYFSKDKAELQHRPALLIGTPGRLYDHINRDTFSTEMITTLVLDEFDKSLEIGFEEEMESIVTGLPNLEKKILTSATSKTRLPEFVQMENPSFVNYLNKGVPTLSIKSIPSPHKDKLQTLLEALCHLGNHPGIIFCNYRESIKRVSDFLLDQGISFACYHGGLEQKDRERALIKFRNGTHQLLIATDLAARGLDIPEIKFIIHYHLPHTDHEFTHRNGRTARMHKEGSAYVLHWDQEALPDFIGELEVETLQIAGLPKPSKWETLFISGGRKDKISKGDIAGLFFKQGNLEKEELGVIELKVDCAFVSVPASKVTELIQKLDNSRLKKKKVRINSI